LVLEVEDLGTVVPPQAKTLPCRISKIDRLAADVIQVQLRLPPTAEFTFIPGQYIDIIGPGGIRRSYSIANASFTDRVLEFHIREVVDGVMSAYWFNEAKSNDLLRLNGPLGTFFLRSSANVDLIFLATGTGIAPVKAILESIPTLNPGHCPKSVTVLWGGRVTQDLYLDVGSLAGVQRFIPVLSRDRSDWTGARGYVHDVLLASNPDLGNATVYACGSDSMINSARIALMEAGLSSKRFFSDAFVCSDSTI
jgi:CDP-4-dehydro-6-deoxyglucose reductase